MNSAARIRSARRKTGMSQQAFAECLGVSRSAVANWEKEDPSGPSVGNFRRIAAVTEMPFDWLASGCVAMPSNPTSISMPETIRMVADDPEEERLLDAFRLVAVKDRGRILEVVVSLMLLVGG